MESPFSTALARIGLSQSDFATLSGMNPDKISGVATGRRRTFPGRVRAALVSVGVDAAALEAEHFEWCDGLAEEIRDRVTTRTTAGAAR